MSKIVLDERLQAIAALVRDGVIIADIGTDHGYLPCHLVSTRKCPRAFACDIAEGPLSRARRNILREGLDARILTLQCDGLSIIPVDACADIIIAGMGGDLIARIILGWEGHKDGEKRFILQPMSKPEHLRRELYREGFVLLNEVAVCCGDFVYTVMLARYTGQPVEVSRFFSHTGLLWNKDPMDGATTIYLRCVWELLCKKAQGLAQSAERAFEALEYAVMAKRIEEKIEACKKE